MFKKSRLLGLLLMTLALLLPSIGLSEPSVSSSVLITEVQTGSVSSASEEFIELYNSTTRAIDISDWKVQYFSATNENFDNPSRTVALNGLLNPGKYYLLASNNYLTEIANAHFSATLAKTGGHVRLVSPDPEIEGFEIERDVVGWGTANLPEGTAALAPEGGQSLLRSVDLAGLYIDSDDNSADFTINSTPAPQADSVEIVSEEEEQTENETENPAAEEPQPSSENEPENNNRTLSDKPIQITELLPNPAPPVADAAGEFVELYNPNNKSVDISDYKLQTGKTFSHEFQFGSLVLKPLEYKAFYVTETGVGLANSEGRARLLDFNGELQSETAGYERAKDGWAWIIYDDVWQWTLTPTPGAKNIPTSLQTLAASTKRGRKPTARFASSKKSNYKKSSPKRLEYKEPDESEAVAPIHPGVLAVVGGMTLTYGAYEYRNDFINKIRAFRRNRAAR